LRTPLPGTVPRQYATFSSESGKIPSIRRSLASSYRSFNVSFFEVVLVGWRGGKENRNYTVFLPPFTRDTRFGAGYIEA
jgi:hypothetical protein